MKVCIIGSYAKALVMTADRIPVAGETLMGRDYRGEFGGKGSDMAVQSSRLGAEVSYIGVIGDDTFGKEFVDLMKDEKIDISGLRITKEKSTGTGFIIKDIEARNVIVVDSGANDLFSKEDIDNAEKLIEEADVVLAQLEIPLDTALYAMKVAKKYGKTTILNPAPAVNLKECDLSDVDILTPNETEARVAVGVPTDSELTNSEIFNGCAALNPLAKNIINDPIINNKFALVTNIPPIDATFAILLIPLDDKNVINITKTAPNIPNV